MQVLTASGAWHSVASPQRSAPDGTVTIARNEFEQLLAGVFGFAGSMYPLGLPMLYNAEKGEDIGVGFEQYVRAVLQSPPAFGAQLVRSLVLSQARFLTRDRYTKEATRLAERELALLRRPWPKGSTAELITKCEWHEGLAGNAYVHRARAQNRLRVLRPDWVTIVLGSDLDPDHPGWQLDADVLGYAYTPGGVRNPTRDRVEMLLPEDVAHWAPLPDPLATERGMSWLTPVVREIQSDIDATRHKIKYFENGATPNLVVKGIPAKDPDDFDAWVDKLEAGHKGIRNAYKTLYLTAGADATVVGANLRDIDYKALQGASETRISVASRVPAPVLGISEGLAGSSLNAGNFGQARRNMADIWFHPTLLSLTEALSQVLAIPDGDELWPDTSEVPFLREDAKDAAEIEQIKATTIRTYVDGGFDPPTAIEAVQAQDVGRLRHTGKLSVQLQEPGTPSNTGGTDA